MLRPDRQCCSLVLNYFKRSGRIEFCITIKRNMVIGGFAGKVWPHRFMVATNIYIKSMLPILLCQTAVLPNCYAPDGSWMTLMKKQNDPYRWNGRNWLWHRNLHCFRYVVKIRLWKILTSISRPCGSGDDLRFGIEQRDHREWL